MSKSSYKSIATDNQWVDVKGAQKLLNITKNRVFVALRNGLLESRKIGKIRQISTKSIMELLDSQQPPETAISIETASEKLGVGHHVIYGAIRRNEIDSIMLRSYFGGRKRYVFKDEVREWVTHKHGKNLPEPCVSLVEAAKILGVSRQRVHQRAKKGAFRTYMQGPRLWIALETVENPLRK